MGGSLKSWFGLASLVALGACSNIIGVSEIEIDPSLDAAGSGGSAGTGAGGKSSGGDTVLPQAGEENGGTAGSSLGGKGGMPSGGSAGVSGEAGMGGEPPSGCGDASDCDDEIACTTDTCLPTGECEHTADDTACTAASGKCTSCQVGIGCVDFEPVQKDLELLFDGTFDEQSGDWQDFSDTDVILPDAAAQSGSHSAFFSAAPLDNDEPAFFVITQPIHIPAGTVKLTLSGWYKMLWAPEEKAGRLRKDEYVVPTLFSLEAEDNGKYIRYWEPRFFDGTDAPQTTWKSFTYDAPKTALSRIQDLDITLDLVAETWDTTYYFDSLSLKATVCE